MKHHCHEREKIDELRSKTGLAAYAYYSEWMRLQRHTIPKIETFAESRLYSSFIKFAQWVEKCRLPNPNGFIKLMEQNDIMPSLWTRGNAYALYSQHYDNIISPEHQFLQSMDFVLDLAKEHCVAPTSLYQTIGIEKVMDLIQRRKLSPWFLIASRSFIDYMKSCDATEKDLLEQGIQLEGMAQRIKEEHDLFTSLTRAAKEMNL